MRGNAMTADEIADGFKSCMDAAHAYIEDLPPGAYKTRARLLANMVHGGLNLLAEHALEGGHIQPFGGTDKPEG